MGFSAREQPGGQKQRRGNCSVRENLDAFISGWSTAKREDSGCDGLLFVLWTVNELLISFTTDGLLGVQSTTAHDVHNLLHTTTY